MSPEEKVPRNIAYTAFACWAARGETTMDLFQFEEVVGDAAPNENVLERAWAVVQSTFRPQEPAMNLLAFSPAVLKRAELVLERAQRIVPSLVSSIEGRVRSYFANHPEFAG